jgi:hypothetical protein
LRDQSGDRPRGAYGVRSTGGSRRGRAQRDERASKPDRAWNWFRVLRLAFGPLQIDPQRFWRLTFAEWRALLAGYADRIKADRRSQAWVLSHLLVAAGCDPNKVTPAKLLGEKERPRKVEPAQPPIDEILRRLRVGGDDGK